MLSGPFIFWTNSKLVNEVLLRFTQQTCRYQLEGNLSRACGYVWKEASRIGYVYSFDTLHLFQRSFSHTGMHMSQLVLPSGRGQRNKIVDGSSQSNGRTFHMLVQHQLKIQRTSQVIFLVSTLSPELNLECGILGQEMFYIWSFCILGYLVAQFEDHCGTIHHMTCQGKLVTMEAAPALVTPIQVQANTLPVATSWQSLSICQKWARDHKTPQAIG